MTGETAHLFLLFAAGVILTLVVGIYSLLRTKNLIRVLIAVEVQMKAVTLLLIVVGYVIQQVALAQALVITLIVIEVSVMVVGVGIVLNVHRQTGSIDTDGIKELKG